MPAPLRLASLLKPPCRREILRADTLLPNLPRRRDLVGAPASSSRSSASNGKGLGRTVEAGLPLRSRRHSPLNPAPKPSKSRVGLEFVRSVTCRFPNQPEAAAVGMGDEDGDPDWLTAFKVSISPSLLKLLLQILPVKMATPTGLLLRMSFFSFGE